MNLGGKRQFFLSENLRFLLAKFGWTQAELSRRSGVRQQQISEWMARRQPRSWSDIKAVADAFCLSGIDELLFADLSKSDRSRNRKETAAIDALLPADGSFHRMRLEILVRRLPDNDE